MSQRVLSFSLLFLVAVGMQASVVATFVDGGVGVSNGTALVGPYDLTADGQTIQGVCISFDLEVGPPYVWTADWFSGASFTQPQLGKLEEADWLVLQFGTQPTNAWVGIHQAIWDIFGASFFDADTISWLAAAEINGGSVDPNSFRVLVPTVPNFTQSFIVQNTIAKPTPEPAEAALVAIVLLLLIRARRAGYVR